MEHAFTDGRVIPVGLKGKRKARKRADYLLSYRRHQPMAIVEAKAWDVPADNGLQQAKQYAEILDLKFAFATNGQEIIEHDYVTGKEATITAFPSPDDLWERWKAGEQIPDEVEDILLTPYHSDPHRTPRYYQITAINRAVETILKGRERILLCLATGTGKSMVAAQVCHRLWQSGWNRKGKTRQAEDPVSSGSKRALGPAHDGRLLSLRGRAPSNQGQGGEEPGHLLLDLPTDRGGREP